MSLKTMSPHYMNKMRFVRGAFGKMRRESSILDVGCGYGEYMELFSAMGFRRVFGLDIDKYGLRGQEGVACGRGEMMPFRSGSFDAVSCVSVLEHAEDDLAVISEIRRVLRSGGTAVVVVPSSSYPFTYDPVNAFLRPFGRKVGIGMWAWGHRRLYGRVPLRRMLEKSGFAVESVSEITHAFVTAFMGYGPYVAGKCLGKSMKKREPGGKEGKSFFAGAFGKLAEIDRKRFSWTPAVEMAFVLRKK